MDTPHRAIHPIPPDADGADVVAPLTAPERACPGDGLHVVVHVAATGNVAYGRVRDTASPGDGSQRRLQHARRGSSPGSWSEQHHPRSEQELGSWRDLNAAALDRVLITCSKRAWQLDAEPPYVVEFEPIDLAQCALDDQG